MHDIGKNIVTVVLQCNNFEVVNMGVMVSCKDILDPRPGGGRGHHRPVRPDHAQPGEMQYVASELQRDPDFRALKIPLLIGGATTRPSAHRRQDRAFYDGPVVYVPDASRAVGVCADLLSEEKASSSARIWWADYARVREQHANRKQVPLVTLEAARANKAPLDWQAYTPPAPSSSAGACSSSTTSRRSPPASTGARSSRPGTWPARTRRPHRRDRRRGGHQGVRDGQRCSGASSIAAGSAPTALMGFWPANTAADDTIEIYTDESRTDGAAEVGAAAHADRAPGDPRRERRRGAAPQPLAGRLHRTQRA